MPSDQVTREQLTAKILEVYLYLYEANAKRNEEATVIKLDQLWDLYE